MCRKEVCGVKKMVEEDGKEERSAHLVAHLGYLLWVGEKLALHGWRPSVVARAQSLGTSISSIPAEYQASIIELTTTMVRNREINNAKFVQPT